VIQSPRRSVTFFFVPLIDVLILLFCMFLLLPIVSKPDDEQAGKEKKKNAGLPTDVAELQDELLLARQRVKNLEADRATEGERTVVPVLQVDGRDGTLFYYDKTGPQPVRVDVETQADAQVFINRQKQVAKGQPVHFLILMPRELSGFPTGPQRKEYRDWFEQRQAAYTFDDPWSAK
jgi:hypothetical protein